MDSICDKSYFYFNVLQWRLDIKSNSIEMKINRNYDFELQNFSKCIFNVLNPFPKRGRIFCLERFHFSLLMLFYTY